MCTQDTKVLNRQILDITYLLNRLLISLINQSFRVLLFFAL